MDDLRDYDDEDPPSEPGYYRPNADGAGYVLEAGTTMLATNCIFCGRPLRDPASVERGCGPYCAEKRGIFRMEGPVNERALEAALGTAPEPMRQTVEAKLPDARAAVSAVIHAAGRAWETNASDRWHYLGSAMELSIALCYPGTAVAIQNRFIEGIEYDEEGNILRRGKQQGIVVEKGARESEMELRLPYLEGATWKATKAALKAAGVRTFKARDGRWHDVFDAGDRQWLLVLNAMVDTLGGMLGVLPNRETFIVPLSKVPVPAPEGKAAGAPTMEDPQPKPKAPEVKVGDTVELHDGRVMVIARMGVSAKGAWVGLVSKGDAESMMERFGELRFSTSRGGVFAGLGDVKVKVATEEEKKAVAEETGSPVPERTAERQMPEALLPWQREGVLWLDEKRSGILAMDMGLGKTVTALAAADAPVLVIVPASLRENWRREANRWRPDLIVSKIEKSSDVTPEALKATCVIMGYDAISDKEIQQSLRARNFRTLIVDEAQAVKELRIYTKEKRSGGTFTFPGKEPKRAAAIYKLAQAIPRRFFLSGTPMINGRPYELWPLLHMAAPHDWPSQEDYWWRYCEPREVHIPGGKTILNVHGRSNLPELRERINGTYMFRRTKELLNLPEKRRDYRSVGLSEDVAMEYRAAAMEFLNWVRRHGGPAAAMRAARAEVIARLTALKRLAGIGKAPTVIEEAARFLLDTGRPLIIMGHHEEALAAIESALSTLGYRVGMITGKVTGRARERVVDEFQTGLPVDKPPEKRRYLDVLVCSITAAGVGLTLTRAEDMFIFERVWRPFDLVQAEDRIYRIGTKNAVTITYYDAANTIDDKLAALLAEKSKTAAQVIDGVDLDEDEAQDRVVRDMFEGLTESMVANSSGGIDIDAVDWANPEVG